MHRHFRTVRDGAPGTVYPFIWSSTHTYGVDDIVAKAGSGRLYRSKRANNRGNDPARLGLWWAVVDVGGGQ